jgi:hypothetical protein
MALRCVKQSLVCRHKHVYYYYHYYQFENAYNHSRQSTSCSSWPLMKNNPTVDSWSTFETIVDSMVNFLEKSRLLV